jgi:hypothetical protein
MITFEGSWSRRGQVPEWAVVIIDFAHKKIVDFQILIIGNGGLKLNYEGSGNTREVEGLKCMIPAWISDGCIISSCHDNDAKPRNAFCDTD